MYFFYSGNNIIINKNVLNALLNIVKMWKIILKEAELAQWYKQLVPISEPQWLFYTIISDDAAIKI